MRCSFLKPISARNPKADRCCRTGLWGSIATALCCLTPLLVFLLGLVGLGFLTSYLDYLLVPLFLMFLILAFYGWTRGGRIISRPPVIAHNTRLEARAENLTDKREHNT